MSSIKELAMLMKAIGQILRDCDLTPTSTKSTNIIRAFYMGYYTGKDIEEIHPFVRLNFECGRFDRLVNMENTDG